MLRAKVNEKWQDYYELCAYEDVEETRRSLF
jgi:hypothetical protein